MAPQEPDATTTASASRKRDRTLTAMARDSSQYPELKAGWPQQASSRGHSTLWPSRSRICTMLTATWGWIRSTKHGTNKVILMSRIQALFVPDAGREMKTGIGRFVNCLRGRGRLWPGHLEGPVVVFAGIGGEEIGAGGVSVVMIKAAGERAEVGIAGEFEGIVHFHDLQMDGVAEGDGEPAFAIFGVEPGLVGRVVEFCDEEIGRASCRER